MYLLIAFNLFIFYSAFSPENAKVTNFVKRFVMGLDPNVKAEEVNGKFNILYLLGMFLHSRSNNF